RPSTSSTVQSRCCCSSYCSCPLLPAEGVRSVERTKGERHGSTKLRELEAESAVREDQGVGEAERPQHPGGQADRGGHHQPHASGARRSEGPEQGAAEDQPVPRRSAAGDEGGRAQGRAGTGTPEEPPLARWRSRH